MAKDDQILRLTQLLFQFTGKIDKMEKDFEAIKNDARETKLDVKFLTLEFKKLWKSRNNR